MKDTNSRWHKKGYFPPFLEKFGGYAIYFVQAG
jgi:hypothetical protein